jgi:2-oxoglutarate ferredoxin oxidoreductase subunit gamma
MNHHCQRFEISLAGFGGQGIITIGKIIGTAFSVFAGKNSVTTQSYGPESRGGACRSEVVVSDGVINYPFVRQADVFVALSQVALDTYIHNLRIGGVLIIDSDTVKNTPNDEQYQIYHVPTVTLSHKAGNLKCQNSVALGALYWTVLYKLIKEEAILQALIETVHRKTINVNRTAFETGKQYIQSNHEMEN